MVGRHSLVNVWETLQRVVTDFTNSLLTSCLLQLLSQRVTSLLTLLHSSTKVPLFVSLEGLLPCGCESPLSTQVLLMGSLHPVRL